jgi:hypothetical protein
LRGTLAAPRFAALTRAVRVPATGRLAPISPAAPSAGIGRHWLSGHAAEYAHDNGQLDPSLPFEELRRRSRINAAAGAADRAHDFSRRIREGLPSMGGPAGPGS